MSDDSWKLVHFIRHLPQLTADERMEMSRNNPKGPAEREEDREEDEFLKAQRRRRKPKRRKSCRRVFWDLFCDFGGFL